MKLEVVLVCAWAVFFSPMAFAAETQVEQDHLPKLEIVRSNNMLSVMNARIEVNGRQLKELAKGERLVEVVDPGRVTIKVDTSYAPGKHIFSFQAERDGQYSFVINDSMETVTVEQTFGSPSKVMKPEVLESGGVLRAVLTGVSNPKQPVPTNSPSPVKAAEVAKPEAAASAPLAVASPVKAASSEKSASEGDSKVEEQLRTLKRFFDQGLISNDVYVERQRKILETMK